MKTMPILIGLVGVLSLGGCVMSANGPTPLPDGPDQCRASQYQSYVGRNRSTLPTPPAGEVRRVVCSTCAVTMDYNPARLNIVYDTDSNLITEVKCG